jgi:hypothetical protein
MGYAVLPWMLYHVFCLDRGWSAGFWLGVWGAFNVLNGIAYFTVYVVLIAGVCWIRVFAERSGPTRRRILANSILALGVSLALAGGRLSTTALVCLDYPRFHPPMFSTTLFAIVGSMLQRPDSETLATMTDPYFWEYCWYFGPVVLALLVGSLYRGWRWWHSFAFLCVYLARGSSYWFEPSYWLSTLPLFSSMYVVSRWRFMAGLGIALAVSDVLAHWRKSGRRSRVWLAHLALAVIALDYVAYGFAILPLAFSTPPTGDRFPGPPLSRERIIQVCSADDFAANSRGYGVIQGYEPLMGYERRAWTERACLGSPAYHGEHWTARGPVVPRYWSPNRIILQIEPGETLHVNQNPGSWWRLNGRPISAFSSMRCAATTRVFTVEADDRGRVVLDIVPRGLWAGLTLHIIGACLVGWIWSTRTWWGPPAPSAVSPG